MAYNNKDAAMLPLHAQNAPVDQVMAPVALAAPVAKRTPAVASTLYILSGAAAVQSIVLDQWTNVMSRTTLVVDDMQTHAVYGWNPSRWDGRSEDWIISDGSAKLEKDNLLGSNFDASRILFIGATALAGLCAMYAYGLLLSGRPTMKLGQTGAPKSAAWTTLAVLGFIASAAQLGACLIYADDYDGRGEYDDGNSKYSPAGCTNDSTPSTGAITCDTLSFGVSFWMQAASSFFAFAASSTVVVFGSDRRLCGLISSLMLFAVFVGSSCLIYFHDFE